MRISYFLNWFYWSGITKAAMEMDPQPSRSLLGIPAHLVRQFAQGLAGAAASAIRGRMPAAVDRVLDSAFAAGYAARRWGLVSLADRAATPLARSV